jgi:hypothetical protein
MAALTGDVEECAGNSEIWWQRRSTCVNRPVCGCRRPDTSALLK